MQPRYGFAGLLGLLFVGAAVTLAVAQKESKDESKQQAADDQGFPNLIAGLKAIEGCVGVKTAQVDGGQEAIFAWFEDKDACLEWYYSDMHQGVQRKFFGQIEFREPLEGVPDDVGPILAIASITQSTKAELAETSLPISQIAIELYKPITGGLYLGGRFAPDKLKVPNIKDYTPRYKTESPPGK